MTTGPLHVECGGRHGIFYDRVTIGRAGDYQIDDPDAAPHHAVVWPGRYWWLACDLGSGTGTFLNETRLWGLRPVTAGDRLRVGNTVITVVPAPEPEDPCQS